MSERLADIVAYTAGEDVSELGKTKAELAYALHCLDRELAITKKLDHRIDDLVKALETARARIDYLGAACNDPKHFEANQSTFLPEIDRVLMSVGGPLK
jgi:hypothetical protein